MFVPLIHSCAGAFVLFVLVNRHISTSLSLTDLRPLSRTVALGLVAGLVAGLVQAVAAAEYAVAGAAEGFAYGVTGGGDATPTISADINELKTLLTSEDPAVTFSTRHITS